MRLLFFRLRWASVCRLWKKYVDAGTCIWYHYLDNELSMAILLFMKIIYR